MQASLISQHKLYDICLVIALGLNLFDIKRVQCLELKECYGAESLGALQSIVVHCDLLGAFNIRSKCITFAIPQFCKPQKLP